MENEGNSLLQLLSSNEERKKILGLVTLRKLAANNGPTAVSVMMPLVIQRFISAPISNSGARKGALLSRKLAYLLIPVCPPYGSGWVTVANAVDRELQLANTANESNPALGELAVYALRCVLSLTFAHIEEYVRSRWEIIVTLATHSRNITLRLAALDAMNLTCRPPVGLERQEQELIVHRIVTKPHFAESLRRLLQDPEGDVCVRAFSLLSNVQLAANAGKIGGCPTLIDPMPGWVVTALGFSQEVCSEILHRCSRLTLKQQQAVQFPLVSLCLAVVRAHPSLISILLSLSDSILASSLQSDWNGSIVINAAVALLSVVTQQKALLLSVFPHLTLCVDKVMGIVQKQVALLAESARESRSHHLPPKQLKSLEAPPSVSFVPFPDSAVEVLHSLLLLMPTAQRLRHALAVMNSCFSVRSLQNPRNGSIDFRPVGFFHTEHAEHFLTSLLTMVCRLASRSLLEIAETSASAILAAATDPHDDSDDEAAAEAEKEKAKEKEKEKAGKRGTTSQSPGPNEKDKDKKAETSKKPSTKASAVLTPLSPLLLRLTAHLNCNPCPKFATLVLENFLGGIASDFGLEVDSFLVDAKMSDTNRSDAADQGATFGGSEPLTKKDYAAKLFRILSHLNLIHQCVQTIFYGLRSSPTVLTASGTFLSILEMSVKAIFGDCTGTVQVFARSLAAPSPLNQPDDLQKALLQMVIKSWNLIETSITIAEGCLPFLVMNATAATVESDEFKALQLLGIPLPDSAEGEGGSEPRKISGVEDQKLLRALSTLTRIAFVRSLADHPVNPSPDGVDGLSVWTLISKGRNSPLVTSSPPPAPMPTGYKPADGLCRATISATSATLRCETTSIFGQETSGGDRATSIQSTGVLTGGAGVAPISQQSSIMSYLSRVDNEERFRRSVGIVTLLYTASIAAGCVADEHADNQNAVVEFVHQEVLPILSYFAQQPFIRNLPKLLTLLSSSLAFMELFSYGDPQNKLLPPSLRTMMAKCFFSARCSISWRSVLLGLNPRFSSPASRWSEANRALHRKVSSRVVTAEGDPVVVTLAYTLLSDQESSPMEAVAVLTNTTSQKRPGGLSHGLAFNAVVSHCPKRGVYATTSQTDVSAPSSSTHVAYRGSGTFLISSLAPKGSVTLVVMYRMSTVVLGESRSVPGAETHYLIQRTDRAPRLTVSDTQSNVATPICNDYTFPISGPIGSQIIGLVGFKCSFAVAAQRSILSTDYGDSDDIFAFMHNEPEADDGDGDGEDGADGEDGEGRPSRKRGRKAPQPLLSFSPRTFLFPIELSHFFLPLQAASCAGSSGLDGHYSLSSLATAAASALFSDLRLPLSDPQTITSAGPNPALANKLSFLFDMGLDAFAEFSLRIGVEELLQVAEAEGWDLAQSPTLTSTSSEPNALSSGTFVVLEDTIPLFNSGGPRSGNASTATGSTRKGISTFVTSINQSFFRGGNVTGEGRNTPSQGVGLDDGVRAIFGCALRGADASSFLATRGSPAAHGQLREGLELVLRCSHAARWILLVISRHPDFHSWALRLAWKLASLSYLEGDL